MAIRTRTPEQRAKDEKYGAEYVRLRRKADQEWEMAGLARQDGDTKAVEEHTRKAQEGQAQLRDLIG
jgi:hypothetical protein